MIIIGAGAAGLMCAIRAGQRGLSVLLLDKAAKLGQKILISGGGRCNFTNLDIVPSAYLSPNPHFCKSALSRYTAWHFIELLSSYGLTYHEKTLEQLFCDQKSAAIVDMLVSEARSHGADIVMQQDIQVVEWQNETYSVKCQSQTFVGRQLVIACGGPSFPKLGASDLALRLAKQFKLKNTPFVPALVPLTLTGEALQRYQTLAGVAVPVEISCRGMTFKENLLFTHRGLSGPAVLQISSYWKKGDSLQVNFCPDVDWPAALSAAKAKQPKQLLTTFLAQQLPKKLAENLVQWAFDNRPLGQFSDKACEAIASQLQRWEFTPSGSEGMKKAEVCTGGIHPDALSSKTFETQQAGLYAIGEAVDVTGWLGGYNFQWAWSSGWCCGDSLRGGLAVENKSFL